MQFYSLIAPAKINLYLDIIGDRPDGFHELVMILQSVELADRVDLQPSDTQNIHLYVQGAGHIWPGSIYERINDPDSSQRIWDFFSKYDINGVIQ